MDERKIQADPEKTEALKKLCKSHNKLMAAIAESASADYTKYDPEVRAQYVKIVGKPIYEVTKISDFWCHELRSVCVKLTSESFLEVLMRMTELYAKGQFSSSVYRRSYRSNDFGYYAAGALNKICDLVWLYTRKESAAEMLLCKTDWVRGLDYYLAAEISLGNTDVKERIRDAVYADDSQTVLSRPLIRAAIISGDEDLVEDLIKLLLAARLQEGLRQAILENADAGSTETMIRFLDVCVRENLFRYSSAIRAFDVWSGLGYGDADASVLAKYAPKALACLRDESVRKEFMSHDNNLDVYLGLWAYGCHEVLDTDRISQELLQEDGHRRKVGWYYVTHSDAPGFKMYLASKHLDERDPEILAWVCANLASTRKLCSSYLSYNAKWGFEAETNDWLPADKEKRKKLFDQLEEVLRFIGNQSKVFSDDPFPGHSIILNGEQVSDCLLSTAGYDMDPDLVRRLFGLSSFFNADRRTALLLHFIDPDDACAREFLRRMLEDRTVGVKQLAARRMKELDLSEEDLQVLIRGFSSKSSDVRKGILAVLTEQNDTVLTDVIRKLLVSPEEYAVQAGIELILQDENRKKELAEEIQAVTARDHSMQTKILLDRLNENKERADETNGFGLYDPEAVREFERSILESKPEKKGLLNRLFSAKKEEYILPQDRFMEIMEKVNAVFERHKDYEYTVEDWDGSHRKILFGDADLRNLQVDMKYGNTMRLRHTGQLKLEMVPFWEEFKEACGICAKDPGQALLLGFTVAANNGNPYNCTTAPWYEPIWKKYDASYHDWAFKNYQFRYHVFQTIAALIVETFDPDALFEEAFAAYKRNVSGLGEENLSRLCSEAAGNYSYYADRDTAVNRRMLRYWREILLKTAETDENFRSFFRYEYRLEKKAGVSIAAGLRMEEFFRACDQLIIPRDVLTEWILFAEGLSQNTIRALTSEKKNKQARQIYETYDWARPYVQNLISGIVRYETGRGEMATPLSSDARGIEYFEGAGHFTALLGALDKESFYRGYVYSNDQTKKQILSRLLKNCWPEESETAESLKKRLAAMHISDRRLLEAVMYAPQWAGLAEEVTGIRGLKSAVWFFHAHINETFSSEKEAECALYSPILPQEFNDGVFDAAWFADAYGTVGEKNFDILYRSAKYITSGGGAHRRSQLYTDAVLGRLNGQELEEEIRQKRNQDKLRAYALIASEDMDQVLQKYVFIEQFRKESRQFGAQRRESEKKACDSALCNLASAAGFADTDRLVWRMESMQTEKMAPVFDGQEIGGYNVRIAVDDEGDVSLVCEKDGKKLKSVPKAIAKDADLLYCREQLKELKDQKSRAVRTLENAMCSQSVFDCAEIIGLLQNPVLCPSVQKLVFTDGNGFGFPVLKEGTLYLVFADEAYAPQGNIRLAHPHDFRQAGIWHPYMEYVYANSIRQPFKQVFREYYPLTAEEKEERMLSRRYAGYQVQPQKTAALLKGRGWTVDYEEGLQKVLYKENIVVRMYAMADWFSPADIEPPTLETVEFFDRGTNENVPLEQIPPVIFSETMRDLDLVVSIACAGGVDPEASHSTVEMRCAIAREILKLMKKDNVRIEGSYAKIEGKRASYTVHMGSGTIHCAGRGVLAVLPVHSSQRKIFLPFADEDPKTAEIISKIVLLAEDEKIRDPSILEQITG